MHRRVISFLSLVVLFPGAFLLRGQQSDFQGWPSVKLNLEIIDNLRLHFEEEIRLRENLYLMDKQVNDLGVSYRFNKVLKAGIYYRLEANWKNSEEYTWRRGLYSDISLQQDLKRFTFGYRIRIQSARIERNREETGLFDGFRHRHKISAEYDLKGIPLTPFIDTELFIDYSGEDLNELKGLRSWIGVDYSIMKIHTFTLKYGIDQELNTPDPLRSFIVAIGYSLNLKLNSGK